MIFASVLDPVNPPANVNRPTSITIGSTAYTLPNAPLDTIAITSPILTDTAQITITASTNISGTSTQCFWSGIYCYLDNNPTNQIWYTQKTNFKGANTGNIIGTSIILQPTSASSQKIFIIRNPYSFGYNSEAFAVRTSGSAPSVVINGGYDTTQINNGYTGSILNVKGSASQGIATTGAFYSSYLYHNFGQYQILQNGSPSLYGVSVNNSNGSSTQYFTLPRYYQDQFRFSTNSNSITNIGSNATAQTNFISIGGGGSMTFGVPLGVNGVGNALSFDYTINDTSTLQTGAQYRGITFRPKLTSLSGGARNIFIYQVSGANYFNAGSDSTLIGADSSARPAGKFEVRGGLSVFQDASIRHIISNGTTPTTGTLGTNVSSATITKGKDAGFTISVTTSGAVSGTICTITFGTAYSNPPVCVFSIADSTTAANVSQGYLNSTAGANATFGFTATAAGTYNFNIVTIGN